MNACRFDDNAACCFRLGNVSAFGLEHSDPSALGLVASRNSLDCGASECVPLAPRASLGLERPGAQSVQARAPQNAREHPGAPGSARSAQDRPGAAGSAQERPGAPRGQQALRALYWRSIGDLLAIYWRSLLAIYRRSYYLWSLCISHIKRINHFVILKCEMCKTPQTLGHMLLPSRGETSSPSTS